MNSGSGFEKLKNSSPDLDPTGHLWDKLEPPECNPSSPRLTSVPRLADALAGR